MLETTTTIGLMLSPPSSPRQTHLSDESIAQAASHKRSASMAFAESTLPTVGISTNVPQTASPMESPVVAAYDLEESKTRRVRTCWDAVVRNPAKALDRELEYMSMYDFGRSSKRGRVASLLTPSVSVNASPDSRRTPRRARPESSSASEAEFSPRDRSSRQSGIPASPVSSSSETERKSPKPRRAPAPSQSRVHDLHYTEMEDFSPSTSLLPPGRSLRAEWKGAPMDLSSDPDVEKLHPAEVHLASVLRLPVEVYLDSKRRLFAEKVQRLRQGLAFRRTDSQKACRIDVNKASRLFGAYERVGWLEDSHFSHLL